MYKVYATIQKYAFSIKYVKKKKKFNHIIYSLRNVEIYNQNYTWSIVEEYYIEIHALVITFVASS